MSFLRIADRARYVDPSETCLSNDMLDERRLWLACVRLWLKS